MTHEEATAHHHRRHREEEEEGSCRGILLNKSGTVGTKNRASWWGKMDRIIVADMAEKKRMLNRWCRAEEEKRVAMITT